ncbi:MAG: hypothetical protein A2340_06520 [Lentisphaerae bacterium RIFOXYB12_FULL_60_10]|nr:MAG: hypothetical protein A2340_06520 [Lentisphaerae bacterium RIFOXYB12_FULL_60_10]
MIASRFQLKSWSERQQVLAVIVLAGLIIFSLAFALLLPLNADRRRTERDIDQMRTQLAARNYLLDETALQQGLNAEHALNRLLYSEWTNAASRVAGVPQHETSVNASVGHIDFKVAVLEASQRLHRKSRALGIILPREFGMDASVNSTEDARQLMLQLRSLENFIELLFAIKAVSFTRAEPLAPVTHRTPPSDEAYLEEYPLDFEFRGDLANVMTFFHEILESSHPFCVRRLRIEVPDDAPDGQINVKGVVSTLVFMKDPVELQPERQTGPRFFSPIGH